MLGDAANHIRHSANAVYLFLQLLQTIGIEFDFRRQRLNVIDRLGRRCLRIFGGGFRYIGCRCCVLGTARHFYRRRCHLINSAGDLQGLFALVIQGLVGSAGVLRYLLADAGNLQGELLDALDHAVDGIDKAVKGTDYRADFVVAGTG